jgi:DNA-binding NarL/FixJ family response regulator
MALRFLIVDDNPHFLSAARDLLEREGAAVVGVASTCSEALQLIEEVRPDVALVDVDLGPESGFDLARLLRDGDHPPVVLISAYAESEFADLIADSPAVGFVSKSELSVRKICELVQRGRDGGGARTNSS